jgi:hypothetical protein
LAVREERERTRLGRLGRCGAVGGKRKRAGGKGLGPGGWLGFFFFLLFIFQSIFTSEFESNTFKPKSQKHRIKYAPA